MLFNISNSIYHVFLSNANILLTAVRFQIADKIIPCKRLNSSIWSIERTLTGTTTPSQSGPENKGNEEEVHITKIPRLESHCQMQFSVIMTLNCSQYSCQILIILFNINHSFAQLNGFKHCYLILIIMFNINQYFAHS